MGALYNITVTTSSGERTSLNRYAGKALLIVNVASHCAYTPQYVGLQRLYEQYKSIGFEVLAFPCNDFGGQEPESIEEIKAFCLSKYGIQFELFDKISAIGDKKHPLFSELTSKAPYPGEVKWNFEKFVISRDGRVVARFPSSLSPESFEIKQTLEQALYN